MKKLGIALSTFDKVEEVAINVEIIRKHWTSNNDAFISVCCNDPDSYSAIQKLDIDAFSIGDTERHDPKPYKRLRQFECIKKSVLNCKSEFAVHYHADACAVNVDNILKIINHLKQNRQFVAFRGKGVDFQGAGKTAYGDVDDHFVFFNCEEVKKRNIFFQPAALTFLHTLNIESFLSKTLKENFTKEELCHYHDMADNRAMNPFNADEKRQFYHCSTLEIMQNKLTELGIKL